MLKSIRKFLKKEEANTTSRRVVCVSNKEIVVSAAIILFCGRDTTEKRMQMAKAFSRQFYKSKAWQKVRALAWKRDSGLCQDCLRKGIIKAGKEVHHIRELTEENIKDPSIALSLSNLVLLCKSCHEARHNEVNKFKRYEISVDGTVSIPPHVNSE